MTDTLAQFGVRREEISPQFEEVQYPKPVEGRVAHIDADFLAYQVSAETRDELDGIRPRKTLEEMQHNARTAAEHLMRLAAATDYRCHLTPSASTKGGRPGQAVQQEYQANRAGREKPEFLDTIRAFIGQELNGVVHLDQEADDGMAQANYNAMGESRSWGKSNLSIIVSRDKDLRMVPGLHLDPEDDTIHCTGDPFGSLFLKEMKSGKKLLGWGTKFFWAQCLMGDTADNIRGLPAACGTLHTEYQPTVAFKKDMAAFVAASPEDPKLPTLEKKIDAVRAKTKKVGPVLAYEMLKDVQTDRDCFELVRSAFIGLKEEHGHEFVHWRTGEEVTPTQALLGDMQLLWMRRNKNPLDVVEWLKEDAK